MQACIRHATKFNPRVNNNVDFARDKCHMLSYRVSKMVSQITAVCDRWIIYVCHQIKYLYRVLRTE